MAEAQHNHDGYTAHDGLFDDCPRCAEKVKRPTELDGGHLRRIWSGSILTRTDMDVFNALYRAVVITQRLIEAFQWEDFDSFMPGAEFGDRIMAFEPAERRDPFTLFEVGGRA